jgi:hypothetical protein
MHSKPAAEAPGHLHGRKENTFSEDLQHGLHPSAFGIPEKILKKSYFKHESRISLDKGYKFDHLELLEDSPDHAA